MPAFETAKCEASNLQERPGASQDFANSPSSSFLSVSLPCHPCHLQPGWQRRPGRTRNGRGSVSHSSQDEPCLVESLPICHFGISLSPKNEASLEPGAALEDMPSTFGATGDLALQSLLDYRRLTRVLPSLTYLTYHTHISTSHQGTCKAKGNQHKPQGGTIAPDVGTD